MLRGASRAPALEGRGRQSAVGPKGGGAELDNPSAQADGAASDQRGTPRAPARQGRGRQPAHGQDDGGAGLRDPLSQAAGSTPALRGTSKAKATEDGRPQPATGLHDGGAELGCQDLDELLLQVQEILDMPILPERSPSATQASGRAAAKPPKPAVRHMSTQTEQTAEQEPVTRTAARLPGRSPLVASKPLVARTPAMVEARCSGAQTSAGIRSWNRSWRWWGAARKESPEVQQAAVRGGVRPSVARTATVQKRSSRAGVERPKLKVADSFESVPLVYLDFDRGVYGRRVLNQEGTTVGWWVTSTEPTARRAWHQLASLQCKLDLTVFDKEQCSVCGALGGLHRSSRCLKVSPVIARLNRGPTNEGVPGSDFPSCEQM